MDASLHGADTRSQHSRGHAETGLCEVRRGQATLQSSQSEGALWGVVGIRGVNTAPFLDPGPLSVESGGQDWGAQGGRCTGEPVGGRLR